MCLNLQACLWGKSGALCSVTTKNEGSRREQLLLISHLFHSYFSSSPLSLLSPLLLRLLKKHNKNTISNLKHFPCVKLDWKPLLKEITSAAEFFVFTVSVRRSGRPCGNTHCRGWQSERISQHTVLRETETFTGVNPSIDGQGYIPSLQVQRRYLAACQQAAILFSSAGRDGVERLGGDGLCKYRSC